MSTDVEDAFADLIRDLRATSLELATGDPPAAETPEPPQPENWMQQKHDLLHWFNLFGKRKSECPTMSKTPSTP